MPTPADSATPTPRRFVSFDELIACRGCDCLHYRQTLRSGQQARCDRCGDVIQTRKHNTVDRSLATALAALVLLLVSLSLPFLSLAKARLHADMTMLDAVGALWESDMRWLGVLTLGFIVILPVVRYTLMIAVLGAVRLRVAPAPWMRSALRWAIDLEPWAMADIFMVGVVVSLVKIGALATLSIGPAFWSLLGLVGCSILFNLVFCRDTLWQLLTPPTL